MNEIPTPRLILRPFRETDYNDLYEFLSQLREDAEEDLLSASRSLFKLPSEE